MASAAQRLLFGRLPFQDARLVAGRLVSEGIRAMVPDYESALGMWGQTVFEVLVEKDQFQEARRIASRVLGAQ